MKGTPSSPGIKEYDLAHNAVILGTSPPSALMFESYIGQPVAKHFSNHALQEELVLRDVNKPKFSRLFSFDSQGNTLVACAVGNLLSCLSMRPGGIRTARPATLKTKTDQSSIEHVEQLAGNYLLICTSYSLFRMSV